MKTKKYYTRKNITPIILSVIASIFVVVIAGYFYISNAMNSSAVAGQDLRINIPNGTTVSQSVELLAEKDALKPVWLFKSIASVVSSQYKKTMKAGYHKFPIGISNIELLKALFTGEYLFYQRITFPEGIGYRRFAEILSNKLKINSDEFVRLATSDSLLSARNIPAKSVEGYLHPSTYTFYLDASVKEIIDVLLDAQDKLWRSKFARKASLASKSRHTILTMASIVESESPIAEERPRVSGVYWNRIARNMLLQADPTVQYAMGEKRRVLFADLKLDNPYNTYKYAGLPPGPINSPSAGSIEAALSPEKHNYIYFVAVGDGSGRHNFATNFDEHRRFARQFREKVRKGK